MSQHQLRLASDVLNIPETIEVAEHLPAIPNLSKSSGAAEQVPVIPSLSRAVENLPDISNNSNLTHALEILPGDHGGHSDAINTAILPNILGKLKNNTKLGPESPGNLSRSDNVNLEISENEAGASKASKISKVISGFPSRLKALPNINPFKKKDFAVDPSNDTSYPDSGVSTTGVHSAYDTSENLDGTPSNDPEEVGGDDDDEEAFLLSALGEERGIWETLLIGICVFVIVITFPITLCMCVKVVQQYERAVIFRCGRVVDNGKPKGPGIIFFIPCLDKVRTLDMRVNTLVINPQEILTNDSVTVTINTVIYYRIKDVPKAVLHVNKIQESASNLACTAFRNALGIRNMRDILLELEDISGLVLKKLNEAAVSWGVVITRVEIKDVKLPSQMQRAMASEGEACTEARAKKVAAEGELQSSKVLKEAADIMQTSPIALQLRYLQTLRTVASESSSTIVFPIPIDLLTPFVNAISPKY